MIRGYCAVCADILHQGHIKFFEYAKQFCDELVVGVMTDEIIENYKGKKPILAYDERAYIVKSIRYVDKVIAQDVFDVAYNVELVKANVFFESSDHDRKGGRATRMFIPYAKGQSSSKIKEKVYKQWKKS